MAVFVMANGPSGVSGVGGNAVLVGWAVTSQYVLTSVTYDTTYTSAISSGSVTWPDGGTGTFTATTINTTFGAVDAYTITYSGALGSHTITQAAVTRNSDGLITAQPALTIT
jgi:hypothetical protein